MNETDRLRDAQKLIDMGVDPDIIMVSQTLDEYAKSHGEEVDEFDVDKQNIYSLECEVLALDEELEIAKEGLNTINITISLLEKEITVTEQVIESCRNWAQKHELQEEVRENEISLSNYIDKKRDITKTIERYERKLETLKSELAIAREDFDKKYAR